MNDKPVFAAFDTGKTPTISCVNLSTIPLGVDFANLVSAMQKFVNGVFAPVWHTPAILVNTPAIIPGTWAMVFMNDSDVANALGYHDLTADGFPLSKIFVRTTLSAGEKVSVTASHELAEMLVDPATNLCAMDEKGVIYAYETADAVEESFFYIDSILMSNFVFPSWFEGFRKPNSDRFDFLGKVKAPFQLASGGYSIIFQNGRWGQIFGSKEKEQRFAKEDRSQHRSEYRKLIKC
jgi:hypothetical protein